MFNWKGLFRSHILERGWNYAYDGSVTGPIHVTHSMHIMLYDISYQCDNRFWMYIGAS